MTSAFPSPPVPSPTSSCTVAIPRGSPPTVAGLVARGAMAALGVAFIVAGACLPAAEPAAGGSRLTVGSTRLDVAWNPFSWTLTDTARGRVVGGTSRRGPGCAPLMVALRPDDDEGRFHRPETPEAGLLWLHAGNATPREDGSLGVELLDEAGTRQGEARVRLSAGPEGFVQMEVAWPEPETRIAMAGACLALEPNEHVVGGGERFDGVDLRGRTIPLAFTLPGPYTSGTNEAHAPVPFLATTRGLALQVDSERVGAFDVGHTWDDALALRFHGNLPLYLRAGPTVEQVAAHARLMGLPPVPPRWILAPMQWRNELDVTVEEGLVVSSGRDRLLDDARTLRALDIPNTGLWIDAPWSTGYNTFAFNEVQFPDPASMIANVEELGFRAIVWATEHMNRSNDEDQMFGMPPHGSRDLFERFASEGWLVRRDVGDDPFVFGWGRGQGGFVDFTHPDAVAALQELIRPLLRMGIRGFKLDYGETMRADLLGLSANDAVRFADGSTPAVQHTRYARLYHEAFLGVLQQEHPDDWFVITRTGGIHDTRNGVTLWPGDLDNDFARAGTPRDGAEAIGGLPAAISGGLSAALSGYPLYGSDIGGYVGGPPSAEVLLRWAQAASLMPVMQLGGGGTGDQTHNPWDARYGPGAVDNYRRYARLHMDLLPTMEAVVRRACLDGTPALLPLGLAAPDDAEAWGDPDAFVLAERLLAFPVVEAGATTRDVHLPAGTWLDWWDDRAREGPLSQRVVAPLDVMPLFQRAGSVVVLGDPRLMTAVSAPDEDVADIDRYGDLRIIRTSAGPDDSFTAVDLQAAQHSEGAHTRVSARSPSERDVIVTLVVQPGRGPGVDAPVRLGETTPPAVADEAALFACTAPCVLRTPSRIQVRARGQDVEVDFGAP